MGLGAVLFLLLWMILDPFGALAHLAAQLRLAHFFDAHSPSDLRYAVRRLLSCVPGGYTTTPRRERQMTDPAFYSMSLRARIGAISPTQKAFVRAARDIEEEANIKASGMSRSGSRSPVSRSSASPTLLATLPSSPTGGGGGGQGCLGSPCDTSSLSPVPGPSPSDGQTPSHYTSPSITSSRRLASPPSSPGRWLPSGQQGEPGRELRGSISQRAAAATLVPTEAQQHQATQLFSWRGYETPRALAEASVEATRDSGGYAVGAFVDISNGSPLRMV